MHRPRMLVAGIALHAALLTVLSWGMLLDLTAVHSRHSGPMLIAAYVGASLLVTAAMFVPAALARRRRGVSREAR